MSGIARSVAEAKPQVTSGTVPLSQPRQKTKRKRPAVSKASVDSEQLDSDDDRSAKKPRHHQSGHDIEVRKQKLYRR
ncbi:hypothetical protein BDU57DRAFT_523605 [Ampelomyces quisqualis]|uniref:Uncharacterized protein n=1 Tax=Ampelomyces quisqualis TaxID=50730 RepID=A0A6A5QA08_AMPQU|nr:hypothetical protein BDU57DRAFT_523605 [Ampelomyces quisqualis]